MGGGEGGEEGVKRWGKGGREGGKVGVGNLTMDYHPILGRSSDTLSRFMLWKQRFKVTYAQTKLSY